MDPHASWCRSAGYWRVVGPDPGHDRQAIESKLAYTEFLCLLIYDEVARRDHTKFALRLGRAAFRSGKSLEGFDFARLPNLRPSRVSPLLRLSITSRLRHGQGRLSPARFTSSA